MTARNAMTTPPATSNSKTPATSFLERGLWNRGWFMAMVCLAFVEIDWEMVPLTIFPFVFIFPVMLVAWNRGIATALTACALMSLSRVGHDYFFDERLTANEVASGLVRFFVLVLLAVLTNLLAQQTRQLRERVQLLEGILPICAGCKSIRDEHGRWLSLEGYITTHTAAQFSHGVCPDCLKAYYGDAPEAKPADK